MSQAPILLLALLAFVVITVLVVYFSRDVRIKRAIRRAPRQDIATFPDGGVGKLVGTVEHGANVLTAPLSGRACVYYLVEVEEYRKHGKSGRWYTIIREVEASAFYLRDATGRALIHAAGAEVAVIKDNHSRSGTFDDATPAEEAFLQRHNRQSKGWFFNKSLRYKEGVLEQGETVAVFGGGTWRINPDPAAGGSYREMAKELVVRAGPSAPLLISDDPSTT